MVALAVVFTGGVAVGRFQLPPYGLLRSLGKLTMFAADQNGVEPDRLDAEAQLVGGAFSESLPTVPALSSLVPQRLDELDQLIDQYVVRNEYWTDQLDLRLEIGDVEERRSPDGRQLLQVDWRLPDATGRAYSYIAHAPARSRCAVLVIPGSGPDQSLSIMEERGYQGHLLDEFDDSCDVYVMIKPNHGIRSMHDGNGRLSEAYLNIGLITRGSSYAARYLTEAVALLDALRPRYPHLVVAGLSQGGWAAVLTALQGEPDVVVSAAGYSALVRKAFPYGYDQLLIPGRHAKVRLTDVLDAIARHPAAFVFLYGRSDSGFAKVEADQSYTCGLLEGRAASNVICEIHDGGHELPRGLVDFLAPRG